jgi:hypothetical protein
MPPVAVSAAVEIPKTSSRTSPTHKPTNTNTDTYTNNANASLRCSPGVYEPTIGMYDGSAANGLYRPNKVTNIKTAVSVENVTPRTPVTDTHDLPARDARRLTQRRDLRDEIVAHDERELPGSHMGCVSGSRPRRSPQIPAGPLQYG